MAAATTTLTLTPAMKTFYAAEFLAHYKESLQLYNFGQKAELPPSGGTTIDWFRYHPLPIVTSAGTEGTLSSAMTTKSLEGMNVTATVVPWYNLIDYSELLYLQSRDGKLTKGVQLLGQNAAESIERETLKTICEACIWPLPANAVYASGAINASVYLEAVQCSTDGTTTTLPVGGGDLGFVLANASVSSGTLVGAWVCVSKGRGYGYSGRVSAYTLSERILTVTPAMPEAPDSKSQDYPTTFTIATPHAAKDPIASGDVLTTKLIQKAESILFKNGAKKFENGSFAGLIHPDVYTGLLADTTWVSAQTNRGGATGLEKNEVGRWGNTIFYRMTTAARYAATDATKNAFSSTAGAVYVTLMMGRDAFGVVALAGRGKPELVIKSPKESGDALEMVGTAGWKAYWKCPPLNGNYSVGIFTYVG